MSKILDIYHASNSIDDSTQIIRLIETKKLNINQSNIIAITSNLFAFDTKFDISNTIIRKFISKNQTIEINFQTYINNYFRLYYEKYIKNRDF